MVEYVSNKTAQIISDYNTSNPRKPIKTSGLRVFKQNYTKSYNLDKIQKEPDSTKPYNENETRAQIINNQKPAVIDHIGDIRENQVYVTSSGEKKTGAEIKKGIDTKNYGVGFGTDSQGNALRRVRGQENTFETFNQFKERTGQETRFKAVNQPTEQIPKQKTTGYYDTYTRQSIYPKEKQIRELNSNSDLRFQFMYKPLDLKSINTLPSWYSNKKVFGREPNPASFMTQKFDIFQQNLQKKTGYDTIPFTNKITKPYSILSKKVDYYGSFVLPHIENSNIKPPVFVTDMIKGIKISIKNPKQTIERINSYGKTILPYTESNKKDLFLKEVKIPALWQEFYDGIVNLPKNISVEKLSPIGVGFVAGSINSYTPYAKKIIGKGIKIGGKLFTRLYIIDIGIKQYKINKYSISEKDFLQNQKQFAKDEVGDLLLFSGGYVAGSKLTKPVYKGYFNYKEQKFITSLDKNPNIKVYDNNFNTNAILGTKGRKNLFEFTKSKSASELMELGLSPRSPSMSVYEFYGEGYKPVKTGNIERLNNLIGSKKFKIVDSYPITEKKYTSTIQTFNDGSNQKQLIGFGKDFSIIKNAKLFEKNTILEYNKNYNIKQTTLKKPNKVGFDIIDKEMYGLNIESKPRDIKPFAQTSLKMTDYNYFGKVEPLRQLKNDYKTGNFYFIAEQKSNPFKITGKKGQFRSSLNIFELLYQQKEQEISLKNPFERQVSKPKFVVNIASSEKSLTSIKTENLFSFFSFNKNKTVQKQEQEQRYKLFSPIKTDFRFNFKPNISFKFTPLFRQTPTFKQNQQFRFKQEQKQEQITIFKFYYPIPKPPYKPDTIKRPPQPPPPDINPDQIITIPNLKFNTSFSFKKSGLFKNINKPVYKASLGGILLNVRATSRKPKTSGLTIRGI